MQECIISTGNNLVFLNAPVSKAINSHGQFFDLNIFVLLIEGEET